MHIRAIVSCNLNTMFDQIVASWIHFVPLFLLFICFRMFYGYYECFKNCSLIYGKRYKDNWRIEMGLRETSQEQGGMKLLKQYTKSGSFGTAMGEFVLIKKSRTALEILRRSAQPKTKQELEKNRVTEEETKMADTYYYRILEGIWSRMTRENDSLLPTFFFIGVVA